MVQTSPRRQGVVHFAAGIAGLLVTLVICASEDIPVAWASVTYFWLGIPVMCMVIWLLAKSWPERPWRWTLSMMLGQVLSSILYGQGHMVPVAMIYVTVLSVPQFLTGLLAARAGTPKPPQESASQ